MAVQYAPTKLKVPPGFQNLLEGFAREVLREQPEDVIAFGARYFKNLLVIRAGINLRSSFTFSYCIHKLLCDSGKFVQLSSILFHVFLRLKENNP